MTTPRKRYSQKYVDDMIVERERIYRMMHGHYRIEAKLHREWKEFAMDVIRKYMPPEDQLKNLEEALAKYARSKVEKS